jgi:hypothetical protein
MNQLLHITPPNLDTQSKKYCRLFEESVINNHTLNQFKILVAGMRFGKTHLMITHDIPFILKYGNADLVITNCPIKGPLTQNSYNITSMCNEYEFFYAGEDIKLAKRALKDGKKVVMTMTNAMAFWNEKFESFYDWIIDKEILSGHISDECWWGTISDGDYVPGVSGNPKIGEEFKGSWYRVMSKLTAHTHLTYGYSATETLMFDPAFFSPKDKKMEYHIEFSLLNPKLLAHRLAWFGEATFYTPSANLFGTPTKDEAFDKMINSLYSIEKITKRKRASFIHAKQTYKDEVLLNNPNKKNEDTVEQIQERLMSRTDLPHDPNDMFGSVLSSDKGCWLFNQKGDIDKLAEDDIYDLLDDQKHPLRHLITVDMAKMGVTVQALKEFFSFKSTDKQNKITGSIVYQINQGEGRVITVNPGMPLSEFFSEYGSIQNVPVFPKGLNTCNFYLQDNKMTRDSIKVLKRDFCPTHEDYKQMLNDNFYPTNEEKCSMGYTLEQHDISDAKHKKLDKQVIDIAPKIEEKLEGKKKKRKA